MIIRKKEIQGVPKFIEVRSEDKAVLFRDTVSNIDLLPFAEIDIGYKMYYLSDGFSDNEIQIIATEYGCTQIIPVTAITMFLAD